MASASYLNSFLVQESLTLMFVALGLAIVGFGCGKLKTKESFYLHRWIMTGATILFLASFLSVMIPSLYLYYAVPNIDLFSGFSVLQIAHSLLGVPTLALSLMFLFNRLPKPIKQWMRITAALWIVGMVLGAIVYYTMPS
jgi:uncharacterized membrane protein YozB (DUF420 family)